METLITAETSTTGRVNNGKHTLFWREATKKLNKIRQKKFLSFFFLFPLQDEESSIQHRWEFRSEARRQVEHIQLNLLLKPPMFFGFTMTSPDCTGRLTGKTDNIHKVVPLRRHQCLYWTFFSWQRKPQRRETELKRQKTFHGFRLFTQMSQRATRCHPGFRYRQINHPKGEAEPNLEVTKRQKTKKKNT